MSASLDQNGLPPDNGEFWLFGYGFVLFFVVAHEAASSPDCVKVLTMAPVEMCICRSLIWKPPPHFDRRIPGFVTGYVRRFWQARYDQPHDPHVHYLNHRGTPTNPGRVVTLLERSYWETLTDHHDTAPDRVWGTAYRIRADKVDEVKEYLDIREINGYTIHYTPFHPAPAAAADGGGPIRTLVYIGTPDNDQFVGPQDVQALAEHIYRSHGPSGPNIDYLLSLHDALEALSPESGDEHVTDLARRVRLLAGRTTKTLTAGDAPHEFKHAKSIEEQEETEK
ncbi:cation transport regulator-like protein 2 [Magnaporthiopsis poae ATCC 64411]|uniref:glutathione-specific gamma-glutamylcyclotransferase n=1 Tax=Magnaporthiopsis poae (strain ATCC 64411 / 73-15) TaxID=644358 RepID=A0A0C4E271_MAGP6|nr:cation transport regulator-like protein 2 [Magnaporthiopsis poae ATCC 64411]